MDHLASAGRSDRHYQAFYAFEENPSMVDCLILMKFLHRLIRPGSTPRLVSQHLRQTPVAVSSGYNRRHQRFHATICSNRWSSTDHHRLRRALLRRPPSKEHARDPCHRQSARSNTHSSRSSQTPNEWPLLEQAIYLHSPVWYFGQIL